MKEIWNEIWIFIQTYWKEIITIISSLIALIIALARRQKLVINRDDEIKEKLIESLPDLIMAVEVPGEGPLKLQTVIKLGLEFVKRLLHRALNDDEIDYFTGIITENVEKILSTPQRKDAK